MVATAEQKRQSRPVQFPGITRAARELRVSRTHLWSVLTGARVSASLKRRWEAWKFGVERKAN